jgi:hypothetical protein
MLKSYYDYLSKDWSFTAPGLDGLAVRYVITPDRLNEFPLAFSGDGINVYVRTQARPMFQIRGSAEKEISPEISSVKWLQNAVKITFNSGQAGDLVFAQNSYPGWYAKVNHFTSPIKEDGIFMSVNVPAGISTVEWIYSPWWSKAGFFLWGLAAILLGLMASWDGEPRGRSRR